jgi:hypothetical protein
LAHLEIDELYGGQVVDERARPVGQHRADRDILGDGERSRSEKRSPWFTASEPTAAPATTRSSSWASRNTRSSR